MNTYRLGFIPTPWQATVFYGLFLTFIGIVVREWSWILSGGLLLGLSIGWFPFLRLLSWCRKRYKQSFEIGLRCAVAGSLILTYETWTQKPAYAFLSRACGVLLKITNIAGDNSGQEQVGNLIRASIYIVRGLFLVYLAIAAVNVFKQMQSGEDWQTAVRAPLVAIILVAVVEGISMIVAPGDVDSNC